MELLEINDKAWKIVPTYFGKTEKTLLDDVETLKNWIKTQPHLPEILGDKAIKNFLILNQGDIETTKNKIDLYYTVRSSIPDLFQHINPRLPNINETMDTVYWTPLPKLTPEMYRVIVFKIRNGDLQDKLEPCNVIRQYINMQEIRLNEDIMHGEIIIGDYTGFNANYANKFTEELLSTWFYIYEEVFSMRVQHFYFINLSEHFGHAIEIMKRVANPVLRDRIHHCEDSSILHQYIPKAILPKDYGGQEKSLEELQDLLKHKLKKYQSRFDRLDQLRVNEKLRPT